MNPTQHKSPLDSAKRKGQQAALDGLSEQACPYVDSHKDSGGLTWSRAFINARRDGHRSVTQKDLFR
jgi:ribosome modulation factor